MAALKQLWENDRLEFHGSAAPYKNYYTFKELLNTCYAKEWIPHLIHMSDNHNRTARIFRNRYQMIKLGSCFVSIVHRATFSDIETHRVKD